MALVDVKPRRSGGQAGVGGEPGQVISRRGRGWTVLFDDPADDEVDAVLAPGIPRVGSMDGNRFCNDVDAVRVGTSLLFEVFADYRSLAGEWPFRSLGADVRPEINWGIATTTEPIDVDAAGKPMVTTAGCPLDPPLSREFRDRTLTVTRRVRKFNSIDRDQWADTVNSDRFFGYPPGLVRCVGISAGEIVEGRTLLYNEIAQFVIRYAKWGKVRPGWRRRVWNAGTVERRADGTLKTIVDADGNPYTQPVPLDQNGAKVDPSEPVRGSGKTPAGVEWIGAPDGRGIWLLFEVYTKRRFKALKLP